MAISWTTLRDARTARGWTQKDLADQIGVHPKTVANWERSGVPSREEYRVRRALGRYLAYARYVNELQPAVEAQTFEEWDAMNEVYRTPDFTKQELDLLDEAVAIQMAAVAKETEERGKVEERAAALSRFGSRELLDEVARRIRVLEDAAADVGEASNPESSGEG